MSIGVTCPICKQEIILTVDQPDPSTGWRGYYVDGVTQDCGHVDILTGYAVPAVADDVDYWHECRQFERDVKEAITIAIAYP